MILFQEHSEDWFRRDLDAPFSIVASKEGPQEGTQKLRNQGVKFETHYQTAEPTNKSLYF